MQETVVRRGLGRLGSVVNPPGNAAMEELEDGRLIQGFAAAVDDHRRASAALLAALLASLFARILVLSVPIPGAAAAPTGPALSPALVVVPLIISIDVSLLVLTVVPIPAAPPAPDASAANGAH
jgi:hypothetical protein